MQILTGILLAAFIYERRRIWREIDRLTTYTVGNELHRISRRLHRERTWALDGHTLDLRGEMHA